MKTQHKFKPSRSQNSLLAVGLVVSSLFLSAAWTRAAESGVQAWVQRYSQVTDSDDQAQKVVTDHAGNVIVAGYSDDGITGQDMLVIKYSGAGVPLWTNRYNGPGNSDDGASAVAVDGSGNVFVTGDYVTIAYSSAGVPLWTNSGSGTAIAVDGSGNVFVTGQSWSGSSHDYATIAYSGAGVPLWTNRYDGPGNGYDQANAVAVDGSGNVFVTGSSPSANVYPYNHDYATIAYSGAGVPLWTNRYDGPGNGYDQASAVAVDGSGNVFVTGASASTNAYPYNRDYATIAYSGAGLPLWTNRCNGPRNFDDPANALAVDGSGNVFVSFWDYATIAYSGAGVPLWTNRYNGPGNGDDHPQAIAVDGSGNVFVTGSSYGSGGYDDYATIAYSGTGVSLWTNRYNGPGNSSDYATAVAVDGSGNVFVTGSSWSGGNDDYATIAYSGAGVPLWTNRYNGPANSGDGAQAVAVDGSGNVFVTGASGYCRFCNSADYATIKYSGAGVPLWTNRYNGPGNSSDYATAVAVDGSGNVFVTGYSVGSGSSYDYATIAYSSAGVPLWTNRYNGPGNSYDEARAMAVDGSGDVLVTGSSATIAYSGAGVPLWTNSGSGTAIAVDGSGNVFVTGSSYGSDGVNSDYATIKYSSAGVPLWTNRYNGPANGDDQARGVAADGSGNVFVTGSSYDSGSFYDYASIKYSGAGVPLWTNRYNGPANGYDSPGGRQSLALGPDGSVYVIGASDGDYGPDFATIKYISVPLPLLTLERDSNAGFFIYVNGAPNVTYRLQRAPGVTGAWSDFATNTAPASGLIEYHDTSPLPGQAFYRAVRQP